MKKWICRGIVSLMVLSAIMPAVLFSADLKTRETDWTWNQYYAMSTNVTTATHTVVGVGFSAKIKAVGEDTWYKIAQTTKTYSDGSKDTVYSHRAKVLASSEIDITFDALVSSPTIILDGLTAAGSTYIWINYGQSRK